MSYSQACAVFITKSMLSSILLKIGKSLLSIYFMNGWSRVRACEGPFRAAGKGEIGQASHHRGHYLVARPRKEVLIFLQSGVSTLYTAGG